MEKGRGAGKKLSYILPKCEQFRRGAVNGGSQTTYYGHRMAIKGKYLKLAPSEI
jgi:hypothetical protein